MPSKLRAHGVTTSTATRPPRPSGTLGTPDGIVHALPSTSNVKWYTPGRSGKRTTQRSGRVPSSGVANQLFQSPAIQIAIIIPS